MTSGDCTVSSLHAALAAAAPVREEDIGVAARAQVDAFDRRDSGAAQGALGGGPQIEMTFDRQVRVEARRDLVADFVAARPDRRTDHCRGLASDRGDARGDDAAAQPTPAGMHEREAALAVRPRDRDRQAVRGERQHRLSGLIAPQSVAGLAADARTVHGRRMNLPVEREVVVGKVDLGANAAAVLFDPLGVVAGAGGEVERLVHSFAHSADARREGNDIARLVPRDHRGSFFARSSSCAFVFSSGARTTSSRSLSSACPIAGPGR